MRGYNRALRSMAICRLPRVHDHIFLALQTAFREASARDGKASARGFSFHAIHASGQEVRDCPSQHELGPRRHTVGAVLVPLLESKWRKGHAGGGGVAVQLLLEGARRKDEVPFPQFSDFQQWAHEGVRPLQQLFTPKHSNELLCDGAFCANAARACAATARRRAQHIQATCQD